MFVYGEKIEGEKNIASDNFKLSPDKIFQVDVKTEGMEDERETANFILKKIREEYPSLEVNWIKADKKRQVIQFQLKRMSTRMTAESQSLFVVSLLSWLPTILTLVGIAATGISLYSIIPQVPWYAWALLGTGLFFLLFGPALADYLAQQVYRPLPRR